MRQAKHKNPIQFDKIHLILHKYLGDFEETYQLSAHICHEFVNPPLDQVIDSLLKKDIHIHTLLTAISSAEKQRLQYAFDSTKNLPMDVQFSTARKIINDFNAIQNALLATADDYFANISQQKTHDISTLQADTGNRSILSNTNEQNSYKETIANSIKNWKKSNSIAIRNYHQGLTVRTITTFVGEQKGDIQIELNEEIARIFAIHSSEKDAFAVCEGEKTQVRLTIKNIQQRVLTLSLGKTFPIYSENRQHLNIQVQEQIPVTISMGKKRQLHARLHDLSIGGIGINVHGINQAPYNIGDKVECQLTLHTQLVVLHGVVRWTGSSDEEARIGVELQPSSSAQQLIQKEVFRMQRNIINAINQLELPQDLKKALT